MTVRQSIVLFAFSTLKTVDDHGGYAFPWYIDPLHLIFPNTAEYHDVHHQMQGLRFNYSQPFFIHFDVLLGTRMSADKFKKMKEIQASKKEKLADSTAATPQHANGNGSAHTSAVAEKTELRRRDAAPADIVNGSSNPFVTTDAASYVAKAGTATS